MEKNEIKIVDWYSTCGSYYISNVYSERSNVIRADITLTPTQQKNKYHMYYTTKLRQTNKGIKIRRKKRRIKFNKRNTS